MGLTLSFAALLACPLRTTSIRLLILIVGVTTWVIFLALTWDRKPLRGLLLALPCAAAAFLGFPSSRGIDRGELRSLYLWRLASFDRTFYFWGGENHLAIDCSGLVRQAMVEALAIYAFRSADPAALRAATFLWWRDSSARELGAHPAGTTVPVGDGRLTRLSDVQGALPGDLAVTGSGSHVIAYLGAGTWIEAEPAIGRTHVFTLDGDFRYLAEERVRFVRWNWLAASNFR